MPKGNKTVLEISLKALENNFGYLKSKLSSGTKFLGVVKANSYGSDAFEVAQKLSELGADYLAVAYTQEGVYLRSKGVQLPILVLHPQACNLEELLDNQLEPNVYSFRILEALKSLSQEHSKISIHIKINTGLNRLGFSVDELPELVDQLKSQKSWKIASVFSHFIASEDSKSRELSLKQISLFKEGVKQLESKLGTIPIKHMANTSGILNYPEAHFDMVRSGIGLYGYSNLKEHDNNLIPMARLKTGISQINQIKEGESIGYNRGMVTQKPMKVATLPLGHADGISRLYGKKNGWVWIHGEKAPIVGNVCMDMLMVDVTHIECLEGDPVIIFDESHPATKVSEAVGTISYELITDIASRIPRSILR